MNLLPTQASAPKTHEVGIKYLTEKSGQKYNTGNQPISIASVFKEIVLIKKSRVFTPYMIW